MLSAILKTRWLVMRPRPLPLRLLVPPQRITPSFRRWTSSTSTPIEVNQEPRLSLTFTCTANVNNNIDSPTPCSHRSSHTFTKKSYTHGIVIIQCPECKNRHLIADNLGWFKDQGPGASKNIEDFMRSKGEKINRGQLNQDGSVTEYLE